MSAIVDAKGNRVYPSLPLATYFANAGLSPRDAAHLEAHVLAQVRSRIIRMSEHDRDHDPGRRFRYLNDHNYRARVNREQITEVILGLGFSRDELRAMDKGLKLGLVAPEPRRMVAHVSGACGEQAFTLEDERPGPDGQRYVLRDERSGEHEVVE